MRLLFSFFKHQQHVRGCREDIRVKYLQQNPDFGFLIYITYGYYCSPALTININIPPGITLFPHSAQQPQQAAGSRQQQQQQQQQLQSSFILISRTIWQLKPKANRRGKENSCARQRDSYTSYGAAQPFFFSTTVINNAFYGFFKRHEVKETRGDTCGGKTAQLNTSGGYPIL